MEIDENFKGEPKLVDRYNKIINNLKEVYRSGFSVCFAGQHGTGKQLCLETELPTPNGFIKLKDLKEGDQLFDEKGNVCNVIKLHPIQLSPESYEITFDDETTVKACADHLWLTHTHKDKMSVWRYNAGHNKTITQCPTVKTTKEILNTLKLRTCNKQLNHSIPCSKPVQYAQQMLSIDPYVLGCWLGDGFSHTAKIECADKQIIREINKAGYETKITNYKFGQSKSKTYSIGEKITVVIPRSNGFTHTAHMYRLSYELKQLNLINKKHIPDIYLRSSYEQRLALLQGLLDTDGSCLKGGSVEFSSCIKDLAMQLCELARSLGIKCNVRRNKASLKGYVCKDRYRVQFTTQLPVFRLKRKLDRIRKDKTQLARTGHRFIKSVEKIKPVPMRCITVDSPSHLFLITRSFIATHNTSVSANIIKKSCLKGYYCLYTTLSDIVAVMLSRDDEDKYMARKELMTTDFLVIDEFDSRFVSSANAADLFGRTLESVFRTRAQNKLPTIMCTNSPNILETFDGSVRDSLESLMKGYLKNVVVIGDDFRKKKQQ